MRTFCTVVLLYVEYPTTVYGDAMKQQVEDRLTFYETGAVPKKNVEVMSTAVEEVLWFPSVLRVVVSL